MKIRHANTLTRLLADKILVTGIWLLVTLMIVATSYASPDKAAFVSSIVYREDAYGDYAFGDVTKATGNRIELKTPYETDDTIYSITANWEFTGQVTMEISATGQSGDYAAVINGVPLEYGSFKAGKKIIWRATLAPGSELTEVKIDYTDLSGVVGSFGTPELSGFLFRKPIYISGPASGDLFHYQIPIRIGESAKAADCDFYLKGVIQADFTDVRFTQADQKTLLPYYLEDIKGEESDRAATFWVKIPQLPAEGIMIYLYYGNADAEDLSDPNSVFDLYDDFQAPLDEEKWTLTLDADFSLYEVANSLLRLDAAKITSNAFGLTDGIIEYRAKTTSGAIAAIVKGRPSDNQNRIAYSSTVAGAQHCIAIGDKVKINDAKPVSIDTFYSYRAIANGDTLTFQRYKDGFAELDAECEYEDKSSPIGDYIGLYAASQGLWVYFDWVRSRKFASPEPEIDIAETKAAQEEVPNLPSFEGLAIGADGDLIVDENETRGTYISQLINAPFDARIIVPSWVSQLASEPVSQLTGKPANRQTGQHISIDISAREYGLFKESCENGAYYYASKDDFTVGDNLRWRARFSSPVRQLASERVNALNSLTSFTMDFRPGTINVVLPNGGETVVVGEEYTIVWDATGYEESYDMKLEYSTDGGRTFNTIATAVNNGGRYVWTVPDPSSLRGADTTSVIASEPEASEAISDKCVVKVSDSLDEAIYDVSNGYFSIVTSLRESPEGATEAISEEAPAAEEAVIEEATEEEAKVATRRPGTSPYELLIKVRDKKAAAKTGPAGYGEGDIVMIKPAGFLWGAEEKSNFVIIKAYLTEKEAAELMKLELGAGGQIVKKRKYKLDITKKEFFSEKVSALKNLLGKRPLVDSKALVEKK